MKICVYCSSSHLTPEKYYHDADKLADAFVENDIELVYGGGSKGLMGRLADRVLSHNGKIMGIIPFFMKEVEWDHPKVENMLFTETMAERKAQLVEVSDAAIALPGGCGTFEEFIELLSAKRLHLTDIPLFLANLHGYYDPMVEMLERSIEQKFMDDSLRELYTVSNSIEELISQVSFAKKRFQAFSKI